MTGGRGRRSSKRATDKGPTFLGQKEGDNEGLPSENPAQEEEAGPTMMMLDPKVIEWPEKRITSQHDDETRGELARSMANGGQEDALVVRRLPDGRYMGAAGFNRWQAAMESGIEVRCNVRDGTLRDVAKANIRTGLNQQTPTPMSVIDGLEEALEQGLLIEEIVQDSGKKPEWIEDRLRILYNASPVVKEHLRQELISEGAAISLSGIEDQEYQDELLRNVITYRWTNDRLVKEIRGVDPDEHQAPERPQNEPRTRRPQTCKGCSSENVEVQTVAVCGGCLEALSPGEGMTVVPTRLLDEAKLVLADSQAGARIAESIDQLLEGE